MNEKKIMLCGDSISKGIIYDSIANKYRKCEATFAGMLDKIFKTKILNISKFGNTVARAEKRFYKSFDENKPDMVIFGLGGNDCDFNWDEVSQDPSGKHIPKTDLKQFKDSLETMTSLVSKEGKRPILMNLTPLDPDAYFNWISHNDKQRKESILSFLGSVNEIYSWQERYSSAVEDVAKKQNIEMIDVRKEFLKEYNYRDCLCEDGIHPNNNGQILIANALENYFRTAG